MEVLTINIRVDYLRFMAAMPAQLADPTAMPDAAVLDRVFAALADPVRRAVLTRLDGADLLVSELAAPFSISLQAVSRHIQVLVRAGLVRQERTGRMPRGLRNSIAAGVRYWAQARGYLYLLTDRYPYAGPSAGRQLRLSPVSGGPAAPHET